MPEFALPLVLLALPLGLPARLLTVRQRVPAAALREPRATAMLLTDRIGVRRRTRWDTALAAALWCLLVIAIAGSGVAVLVVVLGLAYWAQFARLVRGQVLMLRELPYVEAARSIGASPLRVALRHMLPNLVGPVVVMATLSFSNLILLESALSFIGIGVQPPTATLGSMVGQGRDYLASAPWVVATPALLIALVSLCAMLLGEALRDRMDVTLRDR